MPEMHALFYRGMNLGHRGSPTREQVERSLTEAGAERVRSFQTNGTVLIVADDPELVVGAAAKSLAECSGYADVAFLRPVAALRKMLDADLFTGHTDDRTYRECFTFVDGARREPTWSLPWTNARDDVVVIHVAAGVVWSIIRKERGTAGNATAEIEKETGGVATSRTKGTIERLLRTAETW